MTKIEQLMEEIRDTIPTLQGWATVEKAQTLAMFVLTMRPRTVVEIGVFGGRSLIPMAMALRHLGSTGRVVGIDPWSMDASIVGQEGENREWWGKLNHEAIFQGFLTTINKMGLNEVVEIRRMTSDDYEPKNGISILSIDGNHGPQVLRDIKRYAPKVAIGGYLILDDLHWSGGNVNVAFDKLIQSHAGPKFVERFKESGDHDDYAVLQRTR